MSAVAWFLSAASVASGASIVLFGIGSLTSWTVVGLVLGLWTFSSPRIARLLGLFVALGALLASLRLASLDRALTATLAERGAVVSMEGTLIEPVVAGEDDGRTTLAVAMLDGPSGRYRVRERIAMSVRPRAEQGLGYGDRIRVTDARLTPIRTDDSFALNRWRASRRLAAQTIVTTDQIEVLGPARGWMRRAAALARRRAELVGDRLGGERGGLLLGITIGDTSRLSEAALEDFRLTGLTHLVAVSGSNIALVLAAIAGALRAARAPPWVATAVLLATTAWLAMITLFEPSVVRASIMVTIVLVASRLGARTDGTVILGATAFVAALSDPFLPLQLGFQLSVLATFGLLTVARRLAETGERRPIVVAASAALGAQVATMPLLALKLGVLSMIAVPANILVAAIVAPATVIGFVSIGLAMLIPSAGVLAWAAVPCLALMSQTARTLAAVPFASIATPDGLAGILVLVSLVALAVGATRRGGLSRASVVALVFLVPAAGGAFAACSRPAPLAGLTITMLDVGQGDAILVTLDDHAMLIDGGDDRKGLAGMLRSRGIARLDYVVISHAHDDHVSGLVSVVERLAVGAVLDPGLSAELSDYQQILAAIDRRAVPYRVARSGQSYPFGAATIQVLWPADPLIVNTDSDLNENSIVLRINYGSDCALFAGETQELAQAALLADYAEQLHCEILKVSHHGSKRMLPDFYRETGAQIALIPVGNNRYGHPTGEALVALAGMRVLRTDHDGTIDVAIDGAGGVTWRTER